MNTQTDLRETLGAHAHDLDGIPTPDRLDQIHGRVRGIRRRRRATVAGVAAAAVAIVGVATFLPRDHEAAPLDRDLAGHTAPETMDSLGSSYEFVEGTESEQRTRVHLPATQSPRIVSWAAEDASVRLMGPFVETTTSSATDFSDFYFVSPGEPIDLAVVADQGEVAAAVYELGQQAPSQANGDGVFYRQDVAGSRLIASAFGEPGDSEVTVDFTMPDTSLRTSEFCYHVPKNYWVWVSVAGSGGMGTDCDQQAPYDPGAGGNTAPDGWEDAAGHPLRPGDQVTARVWVSKGNPPGQGDAPVSPAPGVHLGIALYAEPVPAVRIGDWEVAPLIEYAGHTYRYADSAESQPGDPELTWTVTAGATPVLIESFSTDTRNGTVRVLAGGEQVGPSSTSLAGGGHRGSIEVIQDRTRHYRYDGGSAVGPKTVLGLVAYDQID